MHQAEDSEPLSPDEKDDDNVAALFELFLLRPLSCWSGGRDRGV